MGSRNLNLGSFGVTFVKRSFSPKMLFLLQTTWYGHGPRMHIDQLDTLYKRLWV